VTGRPGTPVGDPRAQRSREALRRAFNAMVVATPYAQIRVHAIVAAAGVSRSTFYELFASKDALLQDVLAGPFAILADCIDDRVGPAPVLALLEHFWDTREQGRAFLDGALYRRTQAVLARLLLERIRSRRLRLLLPDELAATTLAALQLSILRSWLRHGRADQLPVIVEALSTATVRALRVDTA
jgi:AcrR family transcriptional regulator